MDWLEANSWAAWLALALALGAVEAATVDFVFIMLAGGAAAGGVAAAVGAPFAAQVVTAVAVAALLLGLVRPEIKKRMLAGSAQVALGTAAYVGRHAEVTSEVTADRGRVRIGGEEWSARLASDALPVAIGGRVRVVSIDGATAVVAPAARPEDTVGPTG
ncbi:MAG: NfeD family protein [Austwickia sp.]|jgi:membrane protein implicated in regulation of membrane protease activity|nr:MAG: NfeD family protein [Austwickia sp.]